LVKKKNGSNVISINILNKNGVKQISTYNCIKIAYKNHLNNVAPGRRGGLVSAAPFQDHTSKKLYIVKKYIIISKVF